MSWISVKDRLPEVGKKVLLIVYGWKDSIVYIGKLQPGWSHDDPNGEHNFWGIPVKASDWLIDGWSYFKHPDVHYWTDLPELPEGIKNDN